MGSGRQNDLGYLKGQHQIVRDERTGRLVEIVQPESDYLSSAIFSSGMPVRFSANSTPQNANIQFGSSREFSLYAYLNSIEEEGSENPTGTFDSPFTVFPAAVGAGTAPTGAVVAVGKLIYGDDGTSRTQLINLSPGMATKVPLVGSSARFGPILAPKYFNADDTNAAKRVYRVGDAMGAALVDNGVFNNPDANQLETVLTSVGASQINALTKYATCFAYLGRGAQYGGDSNPKFCRKFYGTMPAGAAGTVSVACPVAYGATQVRLVGPPTLQFTQTSNIGDPLLYTAEIGPFPANSQEQMIDNAASLVITSTAATPALEQAFEIHYYLGL
jgi:hypothetical protein